MFNVFRSVQGWQAGQGSADVINSVLLRFWIMQSFSLPEKESCTVVSIMGDLQAGQGTADAICSILLHFWIMQFFAARQRVMHAFVHHARFSSGARLRRRYLLRPPSFSNYAEFFYCSRKSYAKFSELCQIGDLGKAPEILSAPSSFIFKLCEAFDCLRKKCKAFWKYAKFASWARLRRCYLLRPPSIWNYANFFSAQKRAMQCFLRIMQGLRAGQCSVDAICPLPPSSLIYANLCTARERVMQSFFELCQVCELGKAPQMLSAPSTLLPVLWKSFLLPKKEFCVVFHYAKFAGWAGLHRCYLLRPASCLNYEKVCAARERIMQRFLNYATFASLTRLCSCYLLRPPSFLNYAMFLTDREKVMPSFSELCKVCELRKDPQMLSTPISAFFKLCAVFNCQREIHARFFRNICKVCELGKAPQGLSAPSSFTLGSIKKWMPKKESRKFFSNYGRSASWARVRRFYPLRPPLCSQYEHFYCPRKNYARLLPNMQCLRAGQGSADAICSVLR